MSCTGNEVKASFQYFLVFIDTQYLFSIPVIQFGLNLKI
ncbi:hypothetical protein Mpsy_0416 [Methanolobus psychrophilus R15]|nr:hypothetical protein Mpsy_0416 [Methanolobus psychrophilus R15]